MPTVWFQCDYCGHRWHEYVWATDHMPPCPQCRTSKDVKLLKWSTDVFGYEKPKG